MGTLKNVNPFLLTRNLPIRSNFPLLKKEEKGSESCYKKYYLKLPSAANNIYKQQQQLTWLETEPRLRPGREETELDSEIEAIHYLWSIY